MKEIITKNEKETMVFAKTYARDLGGGEVIALVGNLGAGKTVFTKGLASELGVEKMVNSPTFVIMKVYKIKNLCHAGRQVGKIKNLCHIDAYRASEEDIKNIGAEEYFDRKDTVTVIEWADRVKELLPKTVKYVMIKNRDNTRIINY